MDVVVVADDGFVASAHSVAATAGLRVTAAPSLDAAERLLSGGGFGVLVMDLRGAHAFDAECVRRMRAAFDDRDRQIGALITQRDDDYASRKRLRVTCLW